MLAVTFLFVPCIVLNRIPHDWSAKSHGRVYDHLSSSSDKLTNSVPGAARLLLALARESASDQFRRTLELRPNGSGALFNREDALESLGIHTAAVRRMSSSPGWGHHSLEAETELELGSSLVGKGDLEGAILVFRNILQHHPNDVEAYEKLGEVYTQTGDKPAALAQFRHAVAAEPNSAEAHNGLGRFLRSNGEVEGAIAEFRRAVSLDATSIEGLRNLAQTMEDQGNWAGAAENYRRILVLQPNAGAAYANYGYACMRGERLSEAITELRKAVTLSPGLSSAHFYLAETLAKIGDITAALPEYQEATHLNPKDSGFSLKYGVALSRIRPQQAIIELRRSIELNPNNVSAHESLGTLLRRTGDLHGATTEFQKAKELAMSQEKHSEAVVHTKTAAQYLRQMEASKAVYELKLALVAEPNSAEANVLLGVALSTAGEPAEATKAFKSALQEKPLNPDIHFNWAVFLGRRGDFQDAAKELTSVLALRPGYPQAHCLLARALSSLGEADRSSREMNLARQLGQCEQE
jgi:Tfp pilus assembly protein PilF